MTSGGRYRGYLAGLGFVVVCAVVARASVGVLRLAELVMILPLGVLAISLRFGLGPAIFTVIASLLTVVYFFVPPQYELEVDDPRSLLTLAIILVISTLSCVLAEQLRKQVEQARRQAEVERLRNALLSALSHDLRTPLTALVGAGAVLREGAVDEKERRELSSMVFEEATRLNRLVGNLLELTRLEAGRVSAKRVPQAIDEVIGSALVRLEPRLDGRPVRTSVPEEIPLIEFDPVLIEQVLVNLIENALKYTPAGSPLEIAVHPGEGVVTVEVLDRGPGVPPGHEEKVFEKLYRAAPGERGDGGVGLGLTICRAIITAHEGSITLSNREGGGAVVRFTLPISESGSKERDLTLSVRMEGAE